ncbi:MAG: uncharacterized protein A8A55_2540, partial [Amphiamblys sp. WSBS2006]
ARDPVWDMEAGSIRELERRCKYVATKHQCLSGPRGRKRLPISNATKKPIREKREIGMQLFERGCEVENTELRAQWRKITKEVRAECRREMRLRWDVWRGTVADDFRRGRLTGGVEDDKSRAYGRSAMQGEPAGDARSNRPRLGVSLPRNVPRQNRPLQRQKLLGGQASQSEAARSRG